MNHNVHFLKLIFSLDIKSLIVSHVRTNLSGHVFNCETRQRNNASDKNEENVRILLIASLAFSLFSLFMFL